MYIRDYNKATMVYDTDAFIIDGSQETMYILASDLYDSLVGSKGFITDKDLDARGYQTKKQVDNNIESRGYVTAIEADMLITDKGYQTEDQVENIVESYGYQNSLDVNRIIEGKNYATNARLDEEVEGLASEEWVNQKFEEYEPPIDVDNLVTGIKGPKETDYHRGDVVITPQSISAASEYQYVLDLSFSEYDQNTWYPCVMALGIPFSGSYHWQVFRQLGNVPDNVPSWATHPNGFTVNLDMISKSPGFGATNGTNICFDYSAFFINTDLSDKKHYPIGCTISYQSSKPIVWARGGGVYYVKAEWDFYGFNIYKTRTDIYGDSTYPEWVEPLDYAPFSFTFSTMYGNLISSFIVNLIPKTTLRNAALTPSDQLDNYSMVIYVLYGVEYSDGWILDSVPIVQDLASYNLILRSKASNIAAIYVNLYNNTVSASPLDNANFNYFALAVFGAMKRK